MPFEKRYVEEDVLEGAMRAFWSRGYEGTSINDLTRATGINRGSMYSAFAGKRDLFFQALRHYNQNHCEQALAGLDKSHAPLDAIHRLFQAAANGDGSDGNPAGCLLVNAAMEMSPHDIEIRDFVNDSMSAVQAYVEVMITKAQADGSVAQAVDANKTAASMLGLLVGLRVLARSNTNRETLDAITDQAMALVR